MSRRCFPFLSVLLGGALLTVGQLNAEQVFEYNFAETLAGPVSDGQVAGPGAPFNSAELLDEVSATDSIFQFNVWNNNEGPTAKYALAGATLPAGGASWPHWDGAGIGSNGDVFIRAISDTVELGGPFSVTARFWADGGDNRTGNGPTPNQTIYSGPNLGSNGAWNVFITDAAVDGVFRLEVAMGSEAGGSGEAMRNGYNGAGPIIPTQQWVDVGISFNGDADGDAGNNDEANETLEVYINGKLNTTITGSAVFSTNVGGVFQSIFGDGFGNSQFNGFYERYAAWDRVLSAEEWRGQHIPEPTSGVLFLTAVAALSLRRKRL